MGSGVVHSLSEPNVPVNVEELFISPDTSASAYPLGFAVDVLLKCRRKCTGRVEFRSSRGGAFRCNDKHAHITMAVARVGVHMPARRELFLVVRQVQVTCLTELR